MNDFKFQKDDVLLFGREDSGLPESIIDKSDILIKNLFGNIEDIKISDGDMILNLESGIKLESNFNSKVSLDKNLFYKYEKFFGKYTFAKNLRLLKSNFKSLLNKFILTFGDLI